MEINHNLMDKLLLQKKNYRKRTHKFKYFLTSIRIHYQYKFDHKWIFEENGFHEKNMLYFDCSFIVNTYI